MRTSTLSQSPPQESQLISFGRLAKVLSAIALALLACAPSLAQSLTARQILAKVSETYRNMDSFRSVVANRKYVVGKSVSTASLGEWRGGLATEVAESRPGKVRVSNKDFLLVSDGETTWTYLPDSGRYEEVKVAPLLQEEWRFCPTRSCWGLDHVWIFAHPVPPGHGAKLRGEQSLIVGGRQVECYVITIPLSHVLEREGASETVWVDKSRFIVWRDVFSEGQVAESLEEENLNGVIGGRPADAYALEGLAPGPVPADAFHFDPPAGAKRVEAMAVDSRWDPWLTKGTLDLPEASLIPRVTEMKGPDFRLQALNGKDFPLVDLRGKIVVLDFWASWCKRCEGELAAVQKLNDELASQGVVFLGIDDESPETVKSFAEAHGYTFPILLDSDQTVHQLYGVRWVPTTFVINRKGKIAAQYIGAGGESQLLSALKKAGLKDRR